MNGHIQGLDASLAKTLAARREGVRDRIIVGAICAASFGLLTGWTWAAAWLAAYVALQLAERFWIDELKARGLALGVLSLDSLIFGVLALTAAVRGGAWGAAAGGVLLTAALFTAAAAKHRSWAAFAATVAPLAGYLLIIGALLGRTGGGLSAMLALAAAAAVAALTAYRVWTGATDSVVQQRRARAEADRRRLEAESAAGAAAVFAATAGDELRTPLTTIVTAAAAIEQSPHADPSMRGHAALIGETGQIMRVLLDDLLDLARLDAGRMRVEHMDFDLRDLVAEAAEQWSVQADRRGLDLTLEGCETLPSLVCGDPMRLRQVLNNLISNAIKFTDHGTVTIKALAVRLTEAEQHGLDPMDWLVRLTVADTGPALDAAQIDRLFTPYDPGRDAPLRVQGGTRLGLNISRELARLMGGDLFAETPRGGGAAFTLEVGLAEGRGVTQPPARDLRVLVVDDHEMGRRAASLMLEPYGVQLATAESAESALELLATQPFDIVLMDVSMPQMGGREACRRLRERPGPNRTTPVIACTASTSPKDWEACRIAGMSGLVAKPIDAAALHGAIRAALQAGRAKSAA